MKLLILGGTRFLGRGLVDAALAAGHAVTLFNRGTTNPDIYADLEKLHGDRDGDLSALEGRQWDCVVDTCGFVPRVVGASAQLLADSVERYIFISSISVYDKAIYATANADESAPVATVDDETVEEITGETYGALKALCEKAAEAAMPGRVLQIRSGLIVGPHDPTDRFTYWPVKVAAGGEMLAPPPESPMQIIDVRDLSAWIIRMAEQRRVGTYNTTGPDYALTFGKMLATCQNVIGDGAAEIIPADEAFLLEQGIEPWTHLPLWLPAENSGMSRITIEKALGDGLRFRPLADTVRDTLRWFDEYRDHNRELTGGSIADEREATLLAMWKQSHA